MKFRNDRTGDIMEIPPPNKLGESVVKFNGRVVEHVLYSDTDNSATLGDGRKFTSDEWAKFLTEQLRIGAYALDKTAAGKDPTERALAFDLPAGAEPLFICWQMPDGKTIVHGCDDTSSEDIAKAVAKLYRFMHPGGAKA